MTPKIRNDSQNLQLRDLLYSSTINVLLRFTSIPHLLHHTLIKAKISFKDAATDALSRVCAILQNEYGHQHNQPAHAEVALEGQQCIVETTKTKNAIPWAWGTPDTTSILMLHTMYFNPLCSIRQKNIGTPTRSYRQL